MRCRECRGLGSSIRVLQGETDTPDGGVEFSAKCISFPCHLCKGRGFLPWIPGSTVVRWLYVVLLLPLMGVLALLSRLEGFILFLLGKPSRSAMQPFEIRPFITDTRSGHQLALRKVRQGGGYHFDSLIWRKHPEVGERSLEASIVVATITRSAFQAGSERKRWVSDIHSFDASTGRAIIQVAEADVPMNHPPEQEVNIQYSWREWNIRENRAVRYLATCKLPSDVYSTSAD